MLIGHDDAAAAFLNSHASGRLHHAWLLAGPQGMGKSQLARRIARFLLTREMAGTETDAAPLDDSGSAIAGKLLDAGTHPELFILERQLREKSKDLARNITIDQVRALTGKMHLTLTLGRWRVAIIDAIDDLEPSAANALLKTLEEPPANTVMILISHSPGRLLPTIRSRCRILRLHPLCDDAMTTWLHQTRPLVDITEVRAVALAAGGVPGKALALIDNETAAIERRLRAIAATGDPDNRLREALARESAGIAGKSRYAVLIDLAPALLAQLARENSAFALDEALAAWDELQSVVRNAVTGSYDPAMTAFAIGSSFARLQLDANGRRGQPLASPRAA